MQLQKTSSILIFSILLIILAVGLLGTSVYFLLERKGHAAMPVQQKKDSVVKAHVVVPDTATVLKPEAEAAAPLSADSINARLNEIYEMKKGLTNTNPSTPSDTTDVSGSQRKINELLEKVEQLRSRTTQVESENKYLKSLLEQLTDELHTRQKNLVVTPRRTNTVPVTKANVTANPKLSIADLRVSFLTGSDKETVDAGSAARLSGSFSVRSTMGEPVYVVVTKPDGKVLQASEWDGGIFETTEGRKLYSRKITTESSDASRRISFGIPADNLPRGSYTIQLYTTSGKLAQTSRTLN